MPVATTMVMGMTAWNDWYWYEDWVVIVVIAVSFYFDDLWW
jgi:hypothetical protein